MANPNFKGPLLKPSQQKKAGGQVARISKAAGSRASKPRNRYEELKTEIHKWFRDRFKIAEALAEIKEKKLYRGEYETFDEFCLREYGMSRTYVGRLIDALSTKASVASVPIGTKLTNEAQARALAAVPETSRALILTRAAAVGPVTARSITEAAATVVARKASPKIIDVEANDTVEEQRADPSAPAEPLGIADKDPLIAEAKALAKNLSRIETDCLCTIHCCDHWRIEAAKQIVDLLRQLDRHGYPRHA